MLGLVLIGVGVAAIFLAFMPIVVGSPEQMRLSRRVKHLRGSDRRMLTSAFLRRDAVADDLGDEAAALAQRHWSQRFTVLSSAGIAVMLVGLVLSDRWTLPWWAALLAVVGAVAAAWQAVAGRRYLQRLAGEWSGASHAVSK